MAVTSESTIDINASSDKVWQAITDPEMVKQWFFGTNVESDWQVGSPITFHGEWQGQTYDDKGVIQQIEANELLEYTHSSSRADNDDDPELVRFELTESDGKTTFTIRENNLADDEAKEKSEGLWKMAQESMKKLLES